MCQVTPYLDTVQTDLSEMMRSILVDWMVEVQESFELNHETLYLAVRLVDLYLAQVEVSRETLQLVGATAIFMACKFDVSQGCGVEGRDGCPDGVRSCGGWWGESRPGVLISGEVVCSDLTKE